MRHGKSKAAAQTGLVLAAVFVSTHIWHIAAGVEFFESPLFARQASQGDRVNVILNHVRADKRAQFEEFVFEGLLPALRENARSDPMAKKVLDQTRMLVPAEKTTMKPTHTSG